MQKKTYYIIEEEKQLKIMVVTAEEEFLKDYEGKILCKGESMQEALQNFGKLDYEGE